MNAPTSNLCPQPAAFFLGYAVKQLLPAPAYFTDNRIVHIASVSDCIAKRPPDWVQRWDFNDAGVYNTSAEALAAAHALLKIPILLPPWHVFAYALYPLRFDKYGGQVEVDVQAIFQDPIAPRIEPDLKFLGYDLVERWAETTPGKPIPNALGGGFNCSPLSCNALSIAHPINSFCLLDHWDDATKAARDIAIAQPELGCYYIFGVYRRN